jgi:hypothetical protein
MRRRHVLILIALAAAPMANPVPARAASEMKRSGGVTYVAFNTLTGTITKAGGRRGVLTVDCGLDVPDAKLRELANLSTPRLRAAYVQVVLTYAAGLPSSSLPNPDVIGQALQRQTDLILGRPGAKVLLGAVVTN